MSQGNVHMERMCWLCLVLQDSFPPHPALHLQEDIQDLDALTLAKSYFDLKEYDRAAYFLKGCSSQKAYFLYMYSRYLVTVRRQYPLG